MGLFLGSSLVSPVHLQEADALRDWRYTTLENGTRLLELYMRKDDDIQVLDDNTVINTYCFRDDLYGKNVDLSYVPWINNDMNEVFFGCRNLRNVTNINENVTDMYETFFDCYNLVNISEIPNSVTSMYYTFGHCTKLVNAPIIPNSVTNMSGTFSDCGNLVNAPVIPNSVTDMSYTFYYCYNLVNASEIPNSVANMYETFAGCSNLVNAPEIPDSVTSMSYTFFECSNLVNAPEIPNSVTGMSYAFSGCYNLTGDIIIHSENVINATNCFDNTELLKNVYIPFTYQNGEYTATYNSFMQNYSSGQNGVTLLDINQL